jgi:hypothetical protein
MPLSDKSDYKYQIQLMAEEKAMKIYGLELHQLSDPLQSIVYEAVLNEYFETLAYGL